MAATVQIDESNGAGQTVTANISNSNMGASDSPNLNAVTFPISAGNNSFEKWQRFHVTALGGSSAIQNLQIWRTGALGANATHSTNARASAYGGAQGYLTPVATTSVIATQTMPTTAPGAANLGIGGSLAGQLTGVGFSDYLIHQIQTTSSAVAGTTTALNYQYDEVA